MEIARRQSKSIKVYAVLAASMLSLEVLVGPFGAGTHGELERKVSQHMENTGRSLLEAAEAVSAHHRTEDLSGDIPCLDT